MSMRSVPGRTDHVVVVGAGFAGLSAALHLTGRGRQVTVVERHPWPGGRAGRRDIDGYRIDTGPTVLTMPDLIDEAFAAVGENLSQRLELLPVDPAYRATFADGGRIDVHSDADRMAAAVREFAGPQSEAGYRRLRDWLDRLYRTEFDGFIAANFDSPLNLLNSRLAKLAALGGFRRWDTMVKRHISDPRLRRVFTFQSLYAGVAPQHALAVYAVIAYMDTISGVFFPRGGVRALPDALAAAAADAGVRFCYESTVTALERSGERITAVHTDRDGRIACDAVVLTTELPQTYGLLGRRPRRMLPLRAAPSAVVLHVGCRAVPSASAHHTILFGAEWDQTFTDIIRDGRLMADPSLLVTRPTATDPSLAPDGRDLLYVLAPAPNLTRGDIDWSRTGDAYAQSLLDVVAERLFPGVRDGADGAQLLHVDTPADWARAGHDGRHPVRTGPHLRPDRAVSAGQHRARHRQRRAGRVVDPAGRGCADHVDLRAVGRRPHHRHRGPHQHHQPRPESPIAMIRTELDAAGIEDVRLRAAYRRCRQIAAEHGRTYFLATRLLAPDQRPAVHALYAFARHADDILDELNPALDVRARAARLQALSDRFFAGGDHHDEPVLAAVGHTVDRYGIAADLFEDFLASMRMDLTVTDYPDRAGARPLHARFRGSHWATDASDTGDRGACRRGRTVCGGAGPRVSAHQFLARRRRGSDAQQDLPSGRRTRRLRRGPRTDDVVSHSPAHRRPGA